MTSIRPASRYSSVAIALHWIIALLIIVNLWLGLFGDSLPRDWMVMPVHKATGFTVLALTVARIAWRLTHRPPPLSAGIPPPERGLAHAAHWTFYILLVALPVSGWVMVSGAATRRPLDWYGLFPIPYLPVGEAAGGAGHQVHAVLGYAMVALLVVHILAALRHHVILRDDTLVRMAPILRVR